MFFLLIAVCLTPLASPPLTLALGLIFSVTIGDPYPAKTAKIAPILLRVCVILLGFGMNLGMLMKAGRQGVLFTIAAIFGALILGYFIGRLLKINGKESNLISVGTAICGSGAIAVVGPAIGAETRETSVSLGTIFILNSAALFIFPIIGHAFGLDETQFGVWSAIAIHDTSSVVGAAAQYGDTALQIAVAVKLARVLWVVPVALLFAFLYRPNHGKTNIRQIMPWFILLFLLAAIVRSYSPDIIPPSLFDAIVNLAKAGLNITLFLIGAGLSFKALKEVGIGPLMQGVVLWVVISAVSLWAVCEIL